MSDHAAPFTVQSMPVTANFSKPVLYTTTRWDYLNHYLPSWRKTLRYRLLFFVLALVGVYFFVFGGQPIISAVCWAGSLFYRARYEDIETFIIGSQRPSFEAA
jgi:hypothetical protein